MTSESRMRVYMTGVGGQGTLTATTLLAYTALEAGITVMAGEVHGMAQRGGVVESVVLMGGWLSSKLGHGEADLILGFEPLETLRALPYAAPNGKIFSSIDPLPPLSVSLGKDTYPSIDYITSTIKARAKQAWFLPCRQLGMQAGSVQSGNTVMLGAVCAAGVLPFSIKTLETAIRTHLPAKLVDVNLKAMELGATAVA